MPTVGDKGSLPHSLPQLAVPKVPLSAQTLSIIGLPAITMALVGLLETLMTARLVNDLTDTGSDKHRDSYGQGIAYLLTAFFGGLGGCAMIGQTMINIKIRRTHPRLHVSRRLVAAHPGGGPRLARVHDPDGGAGGGDGRRLLKHLRPEESGTPRPSPRWTASPPNTPNHGKTVEL